MKSGNCYDHQSPTPFVVRNLENDHDEWHWCAILVMLSCLATSSRISILSLT
jgi:hypothetical protein